MFQDILTERLHLRCLRPDDAKAMFAYRSSAAVAEYQSWVPESVGEVVSFIDEVSTRKFNTPGWYQIGISLRDHSELVGDCGIHVLESDPRIAEIGITIAPDFQCNGYASEALNAVFNILFVQLGKHRVVASVDPRNLASMRLMERIGLRKEAHFLQSIWFKNSWADDVVFALLGSEWASKQSG